MTSHKAKNGRSGRTRTPDRRFWRPLLYQTELHSYFSNLFYHNSLQKLIGAKKLFTVVTELPPLKILRQQELETGLRFRF